MRRISVNKRGAFYELKQNVNKIIFKKYFHGEKDDLL